jgi:CubicO group peptidase (beta-lactamase class C family)
MLRALVLSTLLVGLSLSPCAKALAKETPRPDVLDTARQFVDALVKEDFARAVEHFDETMRQEMPIAKTRELWGVLNGQFGAFQRQADTRTEKDGEYQIVYIDCEFEKGPLSARLVFDAQRRIAGIAFVPGRKAEPASAVNEALAGLDELAQGAMKKFNVPGMAIAVVKGHQVVFAKGFGYRDVQKQLPVTADTLFAIGSSTKAFTTLVLGTLVEEGKIEWDKPVRNYIPWFKLHDPVATERLSVRDLVTHRSGLPRHELVWYGNNEVSRKWLVERLAHLEPTADLREKFQYNNLMYITAGYLTETITGKTWEEEVRKRILSPLGMHRTNFSVADSQKDADFAQPHAVHDGKVKQVPFLGMNPGGPCGSINSSANEMACWVIAQLNGGKFGEKKLADATTVAELHKAQVPEYGMGWFNDTYRGHLRVHHGGNVDGFSANVVLLPNDELGMVVLTNQNATPLPNLMAQVIADRLLKLQAIDWIGQGAAQLAAAEKMVQESEKKKNATRVPDTQPSHKLADYTGEYEHAGYGVLRVALRDGKLEACFNDRVTSLAHWHYDTFNGDGGKEQIFHDMKYTFQNDVNGFIASVSVPFEMEVKEIVFKKKPDSRLFHPSYLTRFTGAYDLLGQTIQVSLVGNSLTATVAGQPKADLVPDLNGGFHFKQQQASSLHFLTDEQGQVVGVELRPPGAVLTAKRK